MTIQDIQEYFMNFEQSIIHSQRIKYFIQALDCGKKGLESKKLNNFEKLNYAYSRKLIESLSLESNLPYPEEEWLRYIVISYRNSNVFERIFKDHPKLKTIWKQFLESHNDDLQYIIRLTKENRI